MAQEGAPCSISCLTNTAECNRTKIEHIGGFGASPMTALRLKTLGSSPSTQVAHTLSEVFPEKVTDAASIGFVLARLGQGQAPLLWVQDRLSRKEAGRPYLTRFGINRQVIMVDLSRAADVLWAMEDGLRCKALGAVIGEVWGDPPALSFTASKRLAIRAEASGVPCWLIRRAASPDLSAARDRWRVASVPAAPHPDDGQAPGLPRWSLDLFRSRRSKPGQWVASYDRAADRIDLTAPVRDGTLATHIRAAGQRVAG